MKKKPTKEPKEQQPEQNDPFAPRGGFRYLDVTRLSNDLSRAIDELDGPAHRWAWYALDLVKPFVKAHYATVSKHKDHKDYELERAALAAEARKAGKKTIDLDKLDALSSKYIVYTRYVGKLLGDACEELAIRPFKSEWLSETQRTSPTLSRLLIDYDLMDKPVASAMEHMLYGENEVA